MTRQTISPLFEDGGLRLPVALCILAILVAAVACAPGSDRIARASEPQERPVESALTTAENHIDDAILHFEAKARLLDELGWAAIGIDVDSMDGRVVLSGDVPERSQRELAAEIVRSVDGVETVENLLELEEQSSSDSTAAAHVAEAEHEVRDALLEARLKARLLEEIGRNALDLDVEAADGVVTLRGELDNDAHEQLALETASRTKGVEKVINLIET